MRKRILVAFLITLIPCALVGCGDDDPPGGGEGTGGDTVSSTDEGGGDDISLQSPDAGNMDTGECDNTGFTAAAEAAISEPPQQVMLYQAASSEAFPTDLLLVESYYSADYNGPKAAGTYELTGENYATCGLCITLRTKCSQAPSGQGLVCDKEFLAMSGTVELTAFDPNGTGIAGVLKNVVFEEVAINPQTWESQAVLNAESWCLPNYSFAAEFDTNTGGGGTFNGEMPEATTPAEPDCVAAGNGDLVGNNIANFSLQNCNGDSMNLHDYCGSKVVHVKGVTGWCPSCVADIQAAASEYGSPLTDEKIQAKKPGYRVIYVLGENAQHAPPTAAYCSQFAQQNGLDPAFLYMDYGDNVQIPLIDPPGSGISAGALATVWSNINPYLFAEGNSVSIPFPWDAVLRGSNMEYRTSTTFAPGGNLYSVIDQLLAE